MIADNAKDADGRLCAAGGSWPETAAAEPEGNRIKRDEPYTIGEQDMGQASHMDMVKELMNQFARLTGLEPARETQRRYLWTDAFAVCNFLGLYNRTGDEAYRSLALQLIEQVHHVLGQHRPDDSRTGWISRLDEEEGRMHPTQGGLRIGKGINERRPKEPFDEDLEWDRDGQYFHYLTKWMHALQCAGRVTGDPRFNQWAVELAKAAHARFTYVPRSGGKKSMYWKMSIDLSYPLVRSMGQHDPLDGWITYYELQAGNAEDSDRSQRRNLKAEIEDMTVICEGKKWATDDPLGLGSLLCDAFRIAQLIIHGDLETQDLLEALLDDSLFGLRYYAQNNTLNVPADHRLAFRELGLAIGFRALEKLQDLVDRKPDPFERKDRLRSRIESLTRYRPLCDVIETFWLEPRTRASDNWEKHLDINMVMLATSLAPDGYLTIR